MLTSGGFSAPQIEALNPSVNTFSTRGGDLLTLIGTNFGPVRADNEVSAWYGNSALRNLAGTTFNATNCTVITADVQMRCEVAPGVGHKQRWRTKVGAQASGWSVNTSSYTSPAISLLSSQSIAVDSLSTRGGDLVTISGSNFGPLTSFYGISNEVLMVYQSHVSVSSQLAGFLYDALQCNVTSAHVEILCSTSPGVGGTVYLP